MSRKEQSRRSEGASTARPAGRIDSWLRNHRDAFHTGLDPLLNTPFSALMTIAVIGIALALPAGLFTILTTLQPLGSNLEGAAQISIFLKHDLQHADSRSLIDQLEQNSDIASVETISRDSALQEFRNLSGFEQAIDALPENPLPAVVVVLPAAHLNDPLMIDQLVNSLRSEPEAELVQLDMAWVQRLHSLMALGQRAVTIIAALLTLAVLLVIGNTIRLDVQNRREESEIIKLIGGTDAFIRRPFLYGGLWYGLCGGFAAVLLVGIALWLLEGPATRLIGLYHSTLAPPQLDLTTTGALLGAGALLGLFGSQIAVGRHLRAIEPR